MEKTYRILIRLKTDEHKSQYGLIDILVTSYVKPDVSIDEIEYAKIVLKEKEP